MPARCSGIPNVSDSGPFSWPTYVFFTSLSAEPTFHGKIMLSRFRKLAIECRVPRIVLEASIDAAEAQVTRGLDKKRAEAVVAFLVGPTLPAKSFNIVLLGANNPLIPTAKGAAEAQNRSVMVRVQY